MRRLFFSAILFLAGCREGHSVHLVATADVSYITSWVVGLEFRNPGSEAACVPAFQFSPLYGSLEVRDAQGKEIPPISLANRGLQMFRGLDVVDGLYVVPPGKTKTLLTELNNYDIRQGEKPSVVFDVEYASCAELFRKSGQADIRRLKVTTF